MTTINSLRNLLLSSGLEPLRRWVTGRCSVWRFHWNFRFSNETTTSRSRTWRLLRENTWRLVVHCDSRETRQLVERLLLENNVNVVEVAWDDLFVTL